MIAAACAHGGEEPVLSGIRGAGTVFIAGCNMQCGFCQNYQISQASPMSAWIKTPAEVARLFLQLEQQGCHNIEWVSPTQHLPALVEGLRLAREAGLRLPLVYNSNGYEKVSVLKLLEGIVDIYLPDAKYASAALSRRLSKTPDYVEINRLALQEMWRQVGPLQYDSQGLACRGLIIRHLVLPGFLANTIDTLTWIGNELSLQACISLMAQYYPAHLASAGLMSDKSLQRRLSRREYQKAIAALAAIGLENGWVQELSSHQYFVPDFNRSDPFR